MQRWWLVVAGVVGIGVAVLLVPRPDTGGDVPDRELGEIDVPEPGVRPSEGPVLTTREGTGPPGEEGPLGATPQFEIVDAEVMASRSPKFNPKAAAYQARRDTPEAHYAERAIGPWTQVRRLIAQKNPTDPDEAQLLDEVKKMVDDQRGVMREPWSYDALEFEQRNEELISKVRDSALHDEELEKMLTLLEERLVEYNDEKAGGTEE